LSSARQLSQRDPANTSWQRDVAVTLNKIGDAKLATGDIVAATAEYEQALAGMRRLVDSDRDNALWLSDIAFTLNRIGDAKARGSDVAGARAAYRERLEIMHRLAERDPSRGALQIEIAASLYRLGRIEDGSERDTTLREALAILERLQSQTKLTADQSAWPGMIRAMLTSTPKEP
jgi:tetratricopeptide (TPR) repeat protein